MPYSAPNRANGWNGQPQDWDSWEIVGMATAVEMRHMVRVSMTGGGALVTCFTTVVAGNALSVGDPASVTIEEQAPSLHTINMILTVLPTFR